MEELLIAMCIICLIPFYALFIASYLPKNHPPQRKPPQGKGQSGSVSGKTIAAWWDEYFNPNAYQDVPAIARSRGQVC
ncbi:MAG: hypothetical protein WHV44_07240 [Anaerolineales bacterium]